MCQIQEYPNWKSYGDDKHFPIVSLWHLMVAIVTKVFIDANVINAQPEAYYRWEMIEIVLQACDIAYQRCWWMIDGWWTMDGLPSYKLHWSLRLRWANNTVYVLNVCTPNCLTKWHMQTVNTQIILGPEGVVCSGLHCHLRNNCIKSKT